MTELQRSRAELRAAVMLAGKEIRKLNFGRADSPVLALLRRLLRDARAITRKEGITTRVRLALRPESGRRDSFRYGAITLPWSLGTHFWRLRVRPEVVPGYGRERASPPNCDGGSQDFDVPTTLLKSPSEWSERRRGRRNKLRREVRLSADPLNSTSRRALGAVQC